MKKNLIFINNNEDLIRMGEEFKEGILVYIKPLFINNKAKLFVFDFEKNRYFVDMEKVRLKKIRKIIDNKKLKEGSIFIGFDLEEFLVYTKKENIFLYPILDFKIYAKTITEFNTWGDITELLLEREVDIFYSPIELGDNITRFNIKGYDKYFETLYEISDKVQTILEEENAFMTYALCHKLYALDFDIFFNGFPIDIKKIHNDLEIEKDRNKIFKLEKLNNIFYQGLEITNKRDSRFRLTPSYWGEDLNYGLTDITELEPYILKNKDEEYYTIKHSLKIKDSSCENYLLKHLIYNFYNVLILHKQKVSIAYFSNDRIVFSVGCEGIETTKEKIKIVYISVISSYVEHWDIIPYDGFYLS